MDQIVRWTFMLAAFAIVAHLGLEHYVEQNTTRAAAIAEDGDTSDYVASYEDIEDPLPARAVEVDVGRGGHFYILSLIHI